MDMRRIAVLLCGCCYLIVQCEVSMKLHEQWWEKNFATMDKLYAQWFGGILSPSRVKARKHIQARQYKSVLDIPCSFATEYEGFKYDGIDVKYLGVDISQSFVKAVRTKNIPVLQGNIRDIPRPDSSFDICYCRHMLEHLAGYEVAVDELIRVARCEVLIIFFIKPTAAPDNFSLSLDNNSLLYFNHYNRHALEEYVLRNPKTSEIEWQDVDDKEVLLHIYLNV